jgi:broad specificity phosphatase PhoE
MKIYLARHGQSKWQVGADAHLDTPLTALGREQSKRMGKWLAGQRVLERKACMEIGAIRVSPLERALETASFAAIALHLSAVTQRNLAEAPFRVSDHLPCCHDPLVPHHPVILSTAYAEFKAQAKEALRELTKQAGSGDGAVLAVTHGGVIETMLRLIVGCDAVRFESYNAAITLIEWRDCRWHLVYLNFWDYLPTDLRTN